MEGKGQSKDDEERDQTHDRIRQWSTFIDDRIFFSRFKALPFGQCFLDHALQPPIAERSHEDRDDDADFPAGIRIGSKIFDRDPVLDLR